MNLIEVIVIMIKYRVIFEGEPEDELYDTMEEAEDAAAYSCSCASQGAEILNLSNPGDYDFDENEEYEYEIEEVEVDENGNITSIAVYS